jgi:hypothetical protein
MLQLCEDSIGWYTSAENRYKFNIEVTENHDRGWF